MLLSLFLREIFYSRSITVVKGECRIWYTIPIHRHTVPCVPLLSRFSLLFLIALRCRNLSTYSLDRVEHLHFDWVRFWRRFLATKAEKWVFHDQEWGEWEVWRWWSWGYLVGGLHTQSLFSHCRELGQKQTNRGFSSKCLPHTIYIYYKYKFTMAECQSAIKIDVWCGVFALFLMSFVFFAAHWGTNFKKSKRPFSLNCPSAYNIFLLDFLSFRVQRNILNLKRTPGVQAEHFQVSLLWGVRGLKRLFKNHSKIL